MSKIFVLLSDFWTRSALTIICLLIPSISKGQTATPAPDSTAAGQSTADSLRSGNFHWSVSSPLLAINATRLPASPDHHWIAIKDPSIVRYGGKWHLFSTLRKDKTGDGRIRIGYLSFEEWSDAKDAEWSVLDLTMGYHGAPQIFYFEPQQKWYLVYQAEDNTRQLKYGPCFSTNDSISDPGKWTLPEPLYVVEDGVKAGLDFWMICDDVKAHLFFTTLDGKMWRAETAIGSFPAQEWSKPVIALQADIFEASHTYALSGENKFLTIVEAQAAKRRYFKAFVADRLDGKWTPLAASRERPLVSPKNVVNQKESWATSYSHGEFIRLGVNQKLEIDPHNLELLFQGASDDEYQRGNYGQIPWRLGILKPALVPKTSPN